MTTKRNRIIYAVIGVIMLSALIFGSSFYAKSTLNPTELSHFFVPFPAGKVMRPMTVKQLDGSNIFVRPMVINVDKRGILKRIINPSVEGLSTHWLDNIDTKPHRIGLKFTNVNLEVEWDVHAGIPWDSETKSFEVALGPGERVPDLGVDWLFFFTPEIMAKDVWYDGSLEVFDADTNETLTTIPVKFQKSTAASNTAPNQGGRPASSYK